MRDLAPFYKSQAQKPQRFQHNIVIFQIIMFFVKSVFSSLVNSALILILYSNCSELLEKNHTLEDFMFSFFNQIETTLKSTIPSWRYSYPVDRDAQQVLHPVIQKWQHKNIVIKADALEAALDDFTRTVKISGHLHKVIVNRDGLSDEEYQRKIENEHETKLEEARKTVRVALKKLVSSATAYVSEAQSQLRNPPSQAQIEDALEKWLLNSGGQENIRLINLLIKANEFTNLAYAAEDVKANLGKATPMEMNWFMHKGKICFDFNMQVQQITFGTEKFIMADQVGRIGILTTDQMSESLSHRENLPPILSIKATLQLEIDYQYLRILPTVKKLQVNSFSNLLRSPTQPDDKLSSEPSTSSRSIVRNV